MGKINQSVNNLNTYKIIIKETGKVIGSYRLKVTAERYLIKFKKERLEELEMI